MSLYHKGQKLTGGANGQNATINGETTLEIVAGVGVEIEQQNGTLSISVPDSILSNDITSVQVLTETEYTELTEKISTVLYVIPEEE